MYNQNTINHYGEEKIKKILEKDNYIINLSSIVEDRIRFRIALENYILKYNANPHSEEEKIGIDKYKKEILNTFINDSSAYTNTILLKKENAAILFTSEELLKITQTKNKIANNAQKLYMESKKRELTNDEKDTLMTFFIASIGTKNESLKSAIEDYAKKILEKDVIPQNDMEFKFILNYFHKRMLTDKKLVQDINCDIYLMKSNHVRGNYLNNVILINKESNTNLSLMLKTVCHETQHAIQDYKSEHNQSSVVGFQYAINNLIYRHYKTKEYNPYRCNYRYQDIERNAEEEGYRVASSIYYRLGYNDISESLKNHKSENFQKRAFEYEYIKNENGHNIPKEIYNVTHMNKIMQAHPEYTKEYPVLKNVYHENGQVKSFREMLGSTIMINDPEYHEIYKDYLIYYIKNDELDKLNLNNLNEKEKIMTIKHLVSMFYNECKIVKTMTKYDETQNINKMQRKYTSKYHLHITSSLAKFLSQNYQIIEEMSDKEEFGQFYNVHRYLNDLIDLKNHLSNYKKEDEFKKNMDNELSTINQAYIQTFNTRNWIYIQKKLNELDENTLQKLITLPNGIQISFRKYCEEYIFNNMDRYREITLDNGETISAGEMIRRTLKQMQDNNEIIQETSQKHK